MTFGRPLQISTWPDGSSVAVCDFRPRASEPLVVKDPAGGF
jgi:hypothetical protein